MLRTLLSPVPRRSRAPRGFTLVEMLVVISIIVLLMALAVPSFINVIQANRLTAAGQNMVGRLSQAQQLAASSNNPVEVRFYQYADPAQLTNGLFYYAYQFLQVSTTAATGVGASTLTETITPMSSPFYVESGVVISSTTINGQTASPLLTGGSSGAPTSFTDNGSTASGVSQQINRVAPSTHAQYVAIRFYPDGTVKRITSNKTDSYNLPLAQNLALSDAYLTIVGQKDATGGNNIANYFAVQLDPYTGHARSYQPALPGS